MRFDIAANGPGIWFLLQFQAANAATPGLRRAFRYNVYDLAKKFPCAKCAPHFRELLTEFPPPPAELPPEHPDAAAASAEGYLYWVYNIHKRVNDRLHKPTPDWEELRRQFMESDTCDEGPCLGPVAPTPLPGPSSVPVATPVVRGSVYKLQ